jgi:hypothetical protein
MSEQDLSSGINTPTTESDSPQENLLHRTTTS